MYIVVVIVNVVGVQSLGRLDTAVTSHNSQSQFLRNTLLPLCSQSSSSTVTFLSVSQSGVCLHISYNRPITITISITVFTDFQPPFSLFNSHRFLATTFFTNFHFFKKKSLLQQGAALPVATAPPSFEHVTFVEFCPTSTEISTELLAFRARRM